jgi:levansucrase
MDSRTSAKIIADARAPSLWSADHLRALGESGWMAAPLIKETDIERFCPELDLWDIWPLQLDDGRVAEIAGGSLWMILSAPKLPDPNLRHDVARTRLILRKDGNWIDCGNLFPDGINPGAREWSGSAIFDPAANAVTAYFTAAGRAGQAGQSFEQRLFQTIGTLDLSGPLPVIAGWSTAKQSVKNDGAFYIDLAVDQGIPGRIRGFRDPYWFRDPATGIAYLLFTGSLQGATSDYNGVVGLAVARNSGGTEGFELLPPIVSADCLANELERPHMIVRDGHYYLFWSTQNSVFAPDGVKGPTGLYGMVGPSITGPFEPLNGSGLVITNPPSEPKQAYCWQVLDTLEVVSFIDHWGLDGRDPASDPVLNRSNFGGTIAPMLKIKIDGKTTKLIGLTP